MREERYYWGESGEWEGGEERNLFPTDPTTTTSKGDVVGHWSVGKQIGVGFAVEVGGALAAALLVWCAKGWSGW